MMQKYTLVDLIMVLRDQRFRRYQGINVILSIFDNDSIEPTRKKYMIISGLRALGLYEVGVSPDRRKNFDHVPNEIKGNIRGAIVPAELFRCHLLDAIIQFDAILN